MNYKKSLLFAVSAVGMLVLGSWVLIPNAAPASVQTYDNNEPSSEMTKAMNLLYKEKNAKASLAWFQKELKAHPDNAKASLEYGNALAALKMYEPAKGAYEAAIANGTTQKSDAYYGLALCSANLGTYQEAEFLSQASLQGFSDYSRLLQDEGFAEYRKNYDFMSTFAEVFYYNKEAIGEAFWHFTPKAKKEVFEMDLTQLFNYQQNTKLQIHWAFSDLAEGVDDNAFSRGGGNNFLHEMAYRYTKNYYAVIYSEVIPWADEITPVKYNLVTYSPNGELIDRLEIAFRNAAQAQTVQMNGDRIKTETFDIQLQNKMPAVSTKIQKQAYVLSENGTINKIDG